MIVCASQDDDDELRPVLYSCGGGSKSIVSLPGTHWSKNIPIDSVGIIGAVQVTTDLKKTENQVCERAPSRLCHTLCASEQKPTWLLGRAACYRPSSLAPQSPKAILLQGSRVGESIRWYP